MRDSLTYGEEWREGLHAEFQVRRRAASRDYAERGCSPRRQAVDTMLLAVYIFLEFFLG